MSIVQNVIMTLSFLLSGFICSYVGLAHRNITRKSILESLRITRIIKNLKKRRRKKKNSKGSSCAEQKHKYIEILISSNIS